MGMTKIIAILLIVAGTLGLIYGGFSYTKEKSDVKVGPLQFSLAEKETVNRSTAANNDRNFIERF